TYTAAQRHDFDRYAGAKTVLRWGPRLLAAAPFFGAALGIWSSWLPLTTGQAPRAIIRPAIALQSTLVYAAWLSVGLAVLTIIATTILERSFLLSGGGEARSKARKIFFLANWFLFPALGALSILVVSFYPVDLPQYLGVIPIFTLWTVIVLV